MDQSSNANRVSITLPSRSDITEPQDSGLRGQHKVEPGVISSSECSSVTTHSHFPWSCVPLELKSSDFRTSEGCPCHVCLMKKVSQEHKTQDTRLPECLSVVLVLAFKAAWLSIRVRDERRIGWKILFKSQSHDGNCSETCAEESKMFLWMLNKAIGYMYAFICYKLPVGYYPSSCLFSLF